MKKWLKVILAYILTAVLVFPNVGITVSMAEEPILLYRGGQRLLDGDVIGEDDIVYWKTEVVLSDETESIDLPEYLVYDDEKRVTLETGGGSSAPAEVTDTANGSSITIKNPLYEEEEEEYEEVSAASPSTASNAGAIIKKSKKKISDISNRATVSTASSAAENDAQEEEIYPEQAYILSVPCRIDTLQAGEDGRISIAGLNLIIATNGTELSNTTMSLYKAEGGKPSDKSVGNGDILSLTGEFVLVIEREDMLDVAAGIDYMIQLPEVIGAPHSNGTKPLETVIGGKTVQFGTLAWKAGDTQLSVQFIDFTPVQTEGIDISLKDLTDIYMNFNCGLSSDKLVADEQGRAEIQLPGADPFTVTISELVPKPPKLEKKAVGLDENGIAEWTITYTHPVQAYSGERPEKLMDLIPEGMEYVQGSGQVTSSPADSSGLLSLEDDPKLGTVVCSIPQDLAPGAEVEIQYQTRITDEKMGLIWSKPDGSYEFENQVKAQKADGSDLSPALSAEASVEIPKKWENVLPMVAKEGKLIPGSSGTQAIEWTVTVNTAGRKFKSLSLRDKIGKGLNYDITTLRVNGESVLKSTYQHTEIPGGPEELEIFLVKDNVAAPVYEITYTTQIVQDYFEQTKEDTWTDADVSNVAAVFYEWPDGSGINSPDPPSVGKGPNDVGFNNQMIQKEAIGGYDSKDHSMKWKITVNPNKVPLTKALIVDDISSLTPAHTFIPTDGTNEDIRNQIETAIKEALTAAGIDPGILVEVKLDNYVLTITAGEIGSRSFSFTVTTYVKEPEFWANNASGVFHNRVVMKKEGTEVNKIPIYADSADSADHKAESSVLKKNHTEYNPVDKKLLWQLTVNKNETNLGNLTITDKLPPGLSCQPDDVSAATIDANSFGNGETFAVDADGKITITLQDVKSCRNIIFPTTVDVDSDSFLKEPEVVFKNSAQLHSTAYDSWIDSGEATAVLKNNVMVKNANHQVKGTKVSYTVTLNPLGTDLLKGMAAGSLSVTDMLDDGLYLDLDSVTLFQTDQSVKKDGDQYEVRLDKKPGPGEKPNVSYDAAANSFTIEIPDSKAGYVLQYDAYIVRTGLELTNHVKLKGSAIPESSGNKEAAAGFHMDSGGGASFKLPADKFLSIQIRNINAQGNILNGVEFGLYTSRQEESLLATATCDSATGICTLAVPRSLISGKNTLYWKVRKPPLGYALNNKWQEMTISSAPSPEVTVTHEADSAAIWGEIQIRKVDEITRIPLQGAKFSLYEDQECLIPVEEGRETSASGYCSFEMLNEGIYYLKESEAPDGYQINDGYIQVQVVKNTTAQITVTNRPVTDSSGGHGGHGGYTGESTWSGTGAASGQTVPNAMVESTMQLVAGPPPERSTDLLNTSFHKGEKENLKNLPKTDGRGRMDFWAKLLLISALALGLCLILPLMLRRKKR